MAVLFDKTLAGGCCQPLRKARYILPTDRGRIYSRIKGIMRTVATDVELTKSMEEFATLLQKGIRLEALILFGSYVNGRPDEWSDFDIAVISPDFEGLLRWERGHVIADLTLDRDTRISPIGY
ncbi:MAG: nucleotidyltransferase domain-containing protein, partial [Dehalococcoidia bacterium]|nr:nucleotidyltransferase domain-containing protein [Dehalococcoidia bacterium]